MALPVHIRCGVQALKIIADDRPLHGRSDGTVSAYAKATELTGRAFGLEEQLLALSTRYVVELRGALPAVKVGRSPCPLFALD